MASESNEAPRGLRDKVREHAIFWLGTAVAVVTGVVAFQAAGATIVGWVSPHVPLVARVSDEAAVEQLKAGVDLPWFESRLGTHTYKATDGPYTEYVFERPSCYVQAITSKSGEVLLYTVTARRSDFHPTFEPPGGSDLVEPVTLGVTRFDEWAEPEFVGGWFGASWMHYIESIKMPRSDDSYAVVVASSEAGVYFDTKGNPDYDEELYPDPLNEAIVNNEPDALGLTWYRQGTPINTYGVGSRTFDPAVLYKKDGFPKYEILVGPNRERVGAGESE